MPTKLSDLTDRELLVAHSVKIDNLCSVIRETKVEIASFSSRLDERCVMEHARLEDTHRDIFKKIDNKIDSKTFRWLIGILIAVIITIAGAMSASRTDINQNYDHIQQVMKDIGRLHDGG